MVKTTVRDLDFIYTGEGVSYTDLPSVDFFSKYNPTKENSVFLAALKTYKKIDRTSLAGISVRVFLLNFLKTQLLNFLKSQQDDSSTFIKNIVKTIERKSLHLKKLKALFEKNVLLNEPGVLYNPEIEPLFNSTTLSRLHIRNENIYDYENNVMLGNYILEAVDPAHRFNLTSYVDRWKGSCSQIPFFLYLEEHCNYDLIPQIRYFDDNELAKKKIEFKDGRLIQNGEKITTDSSQEYIFIHDSDGNFYGTSAEKRIKHTSLSRARPLRAAGSLEISDGNIQKIGLDSGHYFPTLQSIYSLLTLLHNNHIPVKDTTEVLYHDKFQKHITTVGRIGRC